MKRVFLFALVFIYAGIFYTCAVGAASGTASSKDISVIMNGKKLLLERQPILSEKRVLVPARTVFKEMGISVDWFPNTKTVVMRQGNKTVKMTIGQKSARVNNSQVLMDSAPKLINGTVMVPVRYTAEAFKAKVKWDGSGNAVRIDGGSSAAGSSRGGTRSSFKVVVDAGHGGKETGAIYGGVYEKDLNLDIAKRLQRLLKNEGIRVYMTREGDSTVGLYERSGLANRLNADLLISVHNNAEVYPVSSGTMTLYHPSSAKSKGGLDTWELASIVQMELTGRLRTNNLRTISRPELAVLRTSLMPAVIAEIGYMTSNRELQKLKTPSYREEAAKALKDAALKALDRI